MGGKWVVVEGKNSGASKKGSSQRREKKIQDTYYEEEPAPSRLAEKPAKQQDSKTSKKQSTNNTRRDYVPPPQRTFVEVMEDRQLGSRLGVLPEEHDNKTVLLQYAVAVCEQAAHGSLLAPADSEVDEIAQPLAAVRHTTVVSTLCHLCLKIGPEALMSVIMAVFGAKGGRARNYVNYGTTSIAAEDGVAALLVLQVALRVNAHTAAKTMDSIAPLFIDPSTGEFRSRESHRNFAYLVAQVADPVSVKGKQAPDANHYGLLLSKLVPLACTPSANYSSMFELMAEKLSSLDHSRQYQYRKVDAESLRSLLASTTVSECDPDALTRVLAALVFEHAVRGGASLAAYMQPLLAVGWVNPCTAAKLVVSCCELDPVATAESWAGLYPSSAAATNNTNAILDQLATGKVKGAVHVKFADKVAAIAVDVLAGRRELGRGRRRSDVVSTADVEETVRLLGKVKKVSNTARITKKPHGTRQSRSRCGCLVSFVVAAAVAATVVVLTFGSLDGVLSFVQNEVRRVTEEMRGSR